MDRSPIVKHRYVALTDIENEPDDTQSFVRLLLYSNEIDLELAVAVTSTWLRFAIHPEGLHRVLEGYAKVQDRLKAVDPEYPTAQSLATKIKPGIVAYGMEGVGEGCDSEGSEALIAVVDKPDQRPIYVGLWGGANCLAQALWKVRKTRSPKRTKAFADKLRVYGISDQDDAGPWIRRNFPMIPYVVSVQGENEYMPSTWIGFSSAGIPGQAFPHAHMVQNEWLGKNIQYGPLGEQYPDVKFGMEGDTPSFIGCVQNGMNDPEHPDWGGWAGRYKLIFDKEARHYHDSIDDVTNEETAERVRSSAATIWRWRKHVQHDFQARMRWTVETDKSKLLFPPRVIVDGDDSAAPARRTVGPNEVVILDASASRSPNGAPLEFLWYQYTEVGALFPMPGLDYKPFETFDTERTSKLKIKTPTETRMPVNDRVEFEKSREYHVILQVTSKGEIPLTRYRRIIFKVVM